MWTHLDGRSLPQPGAPRGPEESAALSVQGIPGQQLTWCVDGREAKVQRTCVTHTLTAGDRTPTAHELPLELVVRGTTGGPRG